MGESINEMSGLNRDPRQMKRNECAANEQARERTRAADYMRTKHGLVESRRPAYEPVKGGKRRR